MSEPQSSTRDADLLRAKMAGVKAGLEGRKMDANTYDEDDERHFVWLGGWTSARMALINKPRE